MNFKDKYPDFAAIERHIHVARAERSLEVAQAIVGAVQSCIAGLRKLAAKVSQGLSAERDRRAIEADAFLKRSVPRY